MDTPVINIFVLQAICGLVCMECGKRCPWNYKTRNQSAGSILLSSSIHST